MPTRPTDLGYRPCVGIMVLNRDGLVWLGRRPGSAQDPEGRGTWWQMPQGGIDPGEDARTAALRELSEETGMTSVEVIAQSAGSYTYDLPTDLQGKVWGGRYRGQRQTWFAVRFLGEDNEVNITPPAGHNVEFDAWQWVPLEVALERIVPFKRAVYQAVGAEFAVFARPVASPRAADEPPSAGATGIKS